MLRSTFIATLVAVATAQEATIDEYSRQGKDVKFVIALNGPALSSPQTSLNLAVDPKQEPKYANRITPVGQRQQFLIGSELRRRYVDEAKTLDEEYIISQMYLQAPFVAKNILSLQAQMMGLYPSTEANDLTEWQQGNAVPPIEGADFTEWQKELGAHALPHGLQTFPIQQTGFEKDFTLSLSQKNCARFAEKIGSRLTKISDDLDLTIAKDYSDIAQEMTEKEVSGEELCDYLTWAHFNAVPLQGDKARQDSYRKLVGQTCPQSYYNQVTNAVLDVNKSESNLVASGFLTTLRDRVNEATASMAVEDATATLPLAFTNYQALNTDILLTIASQALNINAEKMGSLPASSSLIFEVWGDQTVHGFLNDEHFRPVCGDSDKGPCTAENFVAALQANIGFSDLENACADTATADHEFIQA